MWFYSQLPYYLKWIELIGAQGGDSCGNSAS
jgi:hypothetical protein